MSAPARTGKAACRTSGNAEIGGGEPGDRKIRSASFESDAYRNGSGVRVLADRDNGKGGRVISFACTRCVKSACYAGVQLGGVEAEIIDRTGEVNSIRPRGVRPDMKILQSGYVEGRSSGSAFGYQGAIDIKINAAQVAIRRFDRDQMMPISVIERICGGGGASCVVQAEFSAVKTEGGP